MTSTTINAPTTWSWTKTIVRSQQRSTSVNDKTMNTAAGPVTLEAYKLCLAIEDLPASPLQTSLIIRAGELGDKVNELEDALSMVRNLLSSNGYQHGNNLVLKFIRDRDSGGLAWNCIDKYGVWKP